jgi:hypothetical protein
LELDRFQETVSQLGEWHLHCNDQVLRRELSNKALLVALHAAIECLNKHKQYVYNLKKRRCLIWRMKAFPSDLSKALNKVRELIHADPQLMVNHVRTGRATAAALLPFGSDRKYVPISTSIRAVQEALEDQKGPQIVNLYGEPGLGKSSLAKFVALYYQQQNRDRVQSTQCPEISFPDGVQYILCGQNGKGTIRQLQHKLLANLGVRINSAHELSDLTSLGIQKSDDYFRSSSDTKLKLRSCLANKTILIVLDDVWEVEVVTELFTHAKGVKYLVTSQLRDVWFGAENVELIRPTGTQAIQILANHTEGLPKEGEFAASIWVLYLSL